MPAPLKDTDFINRSVFIRGKVRDVYDLEENLLIVATDRISAFDVVFNELIPEKGVVLNSLAAFWFDLTRQIVANHVISVDPHQYPQGLDRFADALSGRSMLVKKTDMLPAECIVRGYLEGSALKAYRETGQVNGIPLPAGLVQADRLPEPIFTPSTKAESGHDVNISYEVFSALVGVDRAAEVRRKSLELYRIAADFAESRGIILADTKFEFGLLEGELMLADEIFTPDSSRFWEKADYQPGRAQKSFDKQYLREWLETLDWDKAPPPPQLPPDVIAQTSAKYKEAYARLTGKRLA
ncbi:MAG: phosphoribosylaminoimidazolesuccinocarboxamide synthase [Clostridiaceae bacterium]|nr:phosphoribosylaminoimidazolesuccinocarboxamide synthase [Clostridiaceae bacterium]